MGRRADLLKVVDCVVVVEDCGDTVAYGSPWPSTHTAVWGLRTYMAPGDVPGLAVVWG